MNENLNEYDVDDMMENYQPEPVSLLSLKWTHRLVSQACGVAFSALSKKAKYCPACRMTIASATMRENNKKAQQRDAYRRKPRSTSKVPAECPTCHRIHLVPAKSVNLADRKHWVYCPQHQRMRDLEEDLNYSVHF